MALLLHEFIVLPILYLLVVKKNPFALFWRTIDALSVGFAAAAR